MSLITHRCTLCKHPDYRRELTRGERSGTCDCGCRCTPGDPEVAPTWTNTGQRVERIATPGEPLHENTRLTTCGCDACKALHQELISITPTPSPPTRRSHPTIPDRCPTCRLYHFPPCPPHNAPQADADPPSTAAPSTRQLRKWAAEHDVPCPPRGRIPAAVREAYDAAHTT